MKKFLLACSAVMLSFTAVTDVSAQWADGGYYIYNVGAGAFLTSGSSWGTKAALGGSVNVELTKQNDGGYQISTNSLYTGKYLGDNAYMDNGTAASWIFTDAGNGKYTMKNGSNYLKKDDSGNGASLTTDEPSGDNYYWMVFTKETLKEYAIANASPESPVNMTAFIVNPDFPRSGDKGLKTGWKNLKDAAGGNDASASNYCGEQWHQTDALSQTLEGLPAGKYKMTVQAFSCQNTGDAYIYASASQTKMKYNGSAPKDLTAAASTFRDESKWVNEVTTTIRTSSMEIGMKTAQNNLWMLCDNFKLYYLGADKDDLNAEIATANALIDDTEYAAYKATLQTAATKAQTVADKQGATQEEVDNACSELITSVESVKAMKTGVIPTNDLRNWVVSELGTGEKLQVNTWSKKEGSDGSNMMPPFIENWIDKGDGVKLSDKTITFAIVGLEAGWYEIGGRFRCLNEMGGVNPQGIYMTMNDNEYSMTDGATAVTNGSYKVLTKAVQVGSDGKLTVGVKVASTNVNWINWKDFTIKAVSAPTVDEIDTEWDKIKGEKCEATLYSAALAAKNKVLDSKSPSDFADFKEAVATVQLSAEAYARVKAALDKGAAIAATFDADGKKAYEDDIDGIPTQYNYGTLLTETCDANAAFILYTAIPKGALAQTTPGSDMTLGILDAAVTDGKGWTNFRNNTGEQYSGAPDAYYMDTCNENSRNINQKVNVKKGFYRLKAVTRGSAGASGNIYMDFKEGYKYNKDINHIGNTGGELGNGWSWTVVDNINIPEDGEVTIGFWSEIKNNNWAGADNFQLTYLGDAACTMTITDAKYATFIAPFDVTMPAGVTAKQIKSIAADNTIEYEEVAKEGATLNANTPALLYSESTVNEPFYGKSTADQTEYGTNLIGCLVKTQAPVGSYLLQNQSGKVGWYKVAEGSTLYCGANRAYLTLPASAGAPEFISLDGETTAISGVKTAGSALDTEAYDLTGRRVNALGKGLYIINGKKIVK